MTDFLKEGTVVKGGVNETTSIVDRPLPPTPTKPKKVDPAAIREAAWVEALDAAHEYTLTQYGMGFLKHPVDRERILALIGEKK
jgi:hypothetical protein